MALDVDERRTNIQEISSSRSRAENPAAMTPTVITCATKLNNTRRMTVDDARNLEARLPAGTLPRGASASRTYSYAMGLVTAQIHQPFVGTATCWNEVAPCNIALMRQCYGHI